jgi:hypothetical protein
MNLGQQMSEPEGMAAVPVKNVPIIVVRESK